MDGYAESRANELELLSLSCNNCGAPLRVPPESRFITCAHCQSQLEIHQAGGAAYTHVLDDINERTQQIAGDVADLKARERLDQLDREWMINREQYMIRVHHGGQSLPSTGAVVGSVFAVIFAIVWTIIAAAGGVPIFALFGVVFIIVAIRQGVSAADKSKGYSTAERVYQARRRSLLGEIRRP